MSTPTDRHTVHKLTDLRSFNHSTCKTVLNLLEAVYLRFRKIVAQRVTVVKIRVDIEAAMVLAVLKSM